MKRKKVRGHYVGLTSELREREWEAKGECGKGKILCRAIKAAERKFREARCAQQNVGLRAQSVERNGQCGQHPRGELQV